MASIKRIMPNFVLLYLATVVLNSCSGGQQTDHHNDQNDQEKGIAEITFEKTLHEFGQIITGERVAYAFRFTNTGTEPLIITGIRSGCGCTVGDYPKDPLKPGQTGRINVVFNSAGRRGFQSEAVRVLNNSEEPVISLRITAEVLEY